MSSRDCEQLPAALEELVGLLIVSARGLMDEPSDYGPLRLLDAAGRMVEALEEQGLTTTDTPALREGIESALDAWSSSTDEFVASLDALILRLVE
jgi:hypothetical protein